MYTVIIAIMSLLQEPHSLSSSQWSWIKADNCADSWGVDKGRADVIIKNNIFTAKLFDEVEKDLLRIELRGTYKNGNIEVVETVHNSDYSGSTYHGTYSRKNVKGSKKIIAIEAINLSDGFSFIGITRTLPP